MFRKEQRIVEGLNEPNQADPPMEPDAGDPEAASHLGDPSRQPIKPSEMDPLARQSYEEGRVMIDAFYRRMDHMGG